MKKELKPKVEAEKPITKCINFNSLQIEQLDGSYKEGIFSDAERMNFANQIYYSTNDIGKAEIARKIYKNQVLELQQDEVQLFREIMDTFGKTFFTAIAQQAILKLIND